MKQHRSADLPGLPPPPGPSPRENEERLPSTTSSAPASDSGPSPFSPTHDSPCSPSPSASSITSGRSTLPEVSSLYSDRENMEDTNAWLLGHHHHQVVAMMHKKFQDLLDYDKTKNRKILHLDWIAGNPDDPIKKEEAAVDHDGMSVADRRMSDKVAEMAITVAHGVNEWDTKTIWNKLMFFGDWLNDQKGLRQFFFEIQIKRISGADEKLLEECGISPAFVWLPLHDEKAPAITPMVVPPPVPRNQIPARALPVPGQIAGEPKPEVQHEEHAISTPTSPPQVPAPLVDKGKCKALSTQTQSGSVHSAAPIIVSSGSPQSQRKQTPLANVGNLALGQKPATDAQYPTAEAGAPRPDILRAQSLPSSGSLESLESPRSHATDTTYGSYEEEGTVYVADRVDPFDALAPAHATPAVSAADLHRHRLEYDRIAYAKREELNHIFSFMNDPVFMKRKKESFIYAVRIIAIPDSGRVVNDFTGPRVEDRYSTHIAQGGWVVPPLEERVRWREERKRAYRNKGAKPGKYEGLPYPQVQRAMPVKFDWSGGIEPRYYGPAPPLWREICDPCLEDVYWMVWQLLAGKQFLGFQPGTGFGKSRSHATGDVAILNQNPFKCPSTEALYHSASYPRKKEQ
ncbi:hypothetical protein P885DRAFT_70952 [Corynascus similis CBS 632.67]